AGGAAETTSWSPTARPRSDAHSTGHGPATPCSSSARATSASSNEASARRRGTRSMWSVASSEPGREPRRVDWTADRFAEATDYRTARALLTALELGLFAPLADAQRSAAELAALIDADPEALTFLLDALAGIGLLE